MIWSENQHQIFKEIILATNHWQPEKQLLIKESIFYTVKAIINESFLHTNMNITDQIERLCGLCP